MTDDDLRPGTGPSPSPLRSCPYCERSYRAELAQRDDWAERFPRYRQGALVQVVWPDATAVQREQLVSGVCSQVCWRQLFPANVSREIAELLRLLMIRAHGEPDLVARTESLLVRLEALA
jgi:hypothetical protein